MANPLCECPIAGFCNRHKMYKTASDHQKCKGEASSADGGWKHWIAWERGLFGATGPANPVTNPVRFRQRDTHSQQQPPLLVQPTAKTHGWVPRNIAGRKPDEPMTPINATISDKRNLLYHLWPSKHSENWKTAIEQLLRRIDLFNGVRSISVVTDEGTVSVEDVQAEFRGVRVDNWLTFPNNPKLREGVSFLPLMATLPRDDSVTFLGHGKSVRHHVGSICVDWAETQYQLVLDDWESVRTALELFPIVGAFKRYGAFGAKCRFRWHYSGGVYWFRQADVFSRNGWQNQIAQWFGATESWPGGVFPQSQAYCVGPDNVGDLYHQSAWDAIKPELDSLFRVREKIRDGVVDDETFFAQSKWKGYTAWHWPPLVEAHSLVAVYLRDVLMCRSVLEIGSGLGMFLVGAIAAGLDARGFDRNALERGFAVSKGVPPDRYTLSLVDGYAITEQVDAIYSCEVFEHCTDEELAPLCRQIAANCKWFYFTSTPHRANEELDRRQGHINIKSREEWLSFFAPFGLTWDRNDTSVCEWGMILKGKL